MCTQSCIIFLCRLQLDGCVLPPDGCRLPLDSYSIHPDGCSHHRFNFTFFPFQTVVNNIHLVLYGDLHVQQALAMVAAEEAYSEVLQLEFETRGEEDEQPPVLQVATANPVLDAAIMKTKDMHIEGDAPPHFPGQTSYSSHASSSLCLDNQEQYSRITHYMNYRDGYGCVPVAPDGSCMFSSLRRIILAPFEYRNIHLRRQLIIMLANHKKFFFNLLKEHIRGTYGFPRQSEEEYQQRYRDGVLTDQEMHDHNCPGPFSFHSYLMALLSPNMWGDEQVLCLCSMLWQIGLIVVSAEKFTQIKFRHKSTLERADGVLVMCLGQHYIPACKYSLFVPPDSCILQPDGCSMHLDGCISPLDGLLSHLVIAPGQFHIATGWMYNTTRQILLATGQLFYFFSQLVHF